MATTTGILVAFLLFLITPSAHAAGVIGNTIPGTTEYPSGGMRLLSESYLYSTSGTLLVGPLNGFAYYVNNDSPATIKKVHLSDGAIVKELRLNPGHYMIHSGVLDPAGFGYFCTETSPSLVVKVRLSDLVIVGSIKLNMDESYLKCAAIDTAKGNLYVGGRNIVRIRLSDFTRQDASSVPMGVYSASVDSSTGFGYFTRYGSIIKIRLSDLSIVQTYSDYMLRFDCGAIDPVSGYGYFGASTIKYFAIYRLRLSDLTLAGYIRDGSYFDSKYTKGIIDSSGGFAYFTSDRISNPKTSYPGYIIKIRLSDFSKAGSLYPVYDGETLYSPVLDPQAGLIYGVQWGGMYRESSCTLARVAYSYKNTIHANKVTLTGPATVRDIRFYVHTGGGKLRLAIYDDKSPRQLVWQSLPTDIKTSNTWVVAPNGAGIKSLCTLSPGTYWLAWQTDSSCDAPSFSSDAVDFSFFRPFGDFPAFIDPASTKASWSNWSIYATLNANAARDWILYR